MLEMVARLVPSAMTQVLSTPSEKATTFCEATTSALMASARSAASAAFVPTAVNAQVVPSTAGETVPAASLAWVK